MFVPKGSLCRKKRSRDSFDAVSGSSRDIVNPRSTKRQRWSLDPSPEASGRPVKKRESVHQAEAYFGHRPPRFWDTLSKVRLSRGAIREFERRAVHWKAKKQRLPASTGAPSTANALRGVKRFSRHGGPELSHLRGYACLPSLDDTMGRSSSRSKKHSSTSKGGLSIEKTTSSPYDPDFEQKLIDNEIYPEGYDDSENEVYVEPANIVDVQSTIRATRPSLSPSSFTDATFREFKRINAKTAHEKDGVFKIMPTIDGGKKYTSRMDVPYTNLAPIVEDATMLKPDMYDGVLPARIDPEVRHSLSEHIIPSRKTSLPAVPNFFVEGKSASGRADVAKLQACHAGAVGARAMHSLQNHKASEPRYDGNMNSYSTTYHPGTATLQLYGHHMTAPHAPAGRPLYHMTQIKGYQMTSDRKTFQKGATAFRNLRDLAKSDRDSFIEEANRGAGHYSAPSPSTTLTESRGSRSVLYDDQSDTSADELAAEQSATKRPRHGSGTRRSAGMCPPDVPPKSRQAVAQEPKRRIKPTQKLIDSKHSLIESGRAEKGRHGP